MPKKIPLSLGDTYGSFTVTGLAETVHGHSRCLVTCSCGVTRTVRNTNLRAGTVRCGCAAASAPTDPVLALLTTISERLGKLEAARPVLASALPAARNTGKPVITYASVIGDLKGDAARRAIRAEIMRGIALTMLPCARRTPELQEEVRQITQLVNITPNTPRALAELVRRVYRGYNDWGQLYDTIDED